MDSLQYKTYVHILFSEENSIICPHLEEVCTILIACFQEAIRRQFSVYARDLSMTLQVLVKIRRSQYTY